LKQGYIYNHRECPFENKIFENILAKASCDIYPSPLYPKINFPQHWPKVTRILPIGYRRQSKNDIIEFGIKNYQNVHAILLFLTKKCNLNCEICFDKLAPDRENMSINYIKNIVGDYNRTFVILFGGEPTERNDLPEIIRIVRKSGNYPLLFTNGLKLSNKQYLRQLKKAGLKSICLSLDSLEPEISIKMRGFSKEVFELKLKALRNLKEEGIRTHLNTTLIREFYKYQILQIINYAEKNEFITNLWFRSFSPTTNEMDLENIKANLVSVQEIQNVICWYLGVSPDYFRLWNKLKFELINLISKYLPSYLLPIKFPVFITNVAYLKKGKDNLIPIFTNAELEEIIKTIEQKRYVNLFNMKKLRWGLKFIKYINALENPSPFTIVTRHDTYEYSNYIVPDNDWTITTLLYYPDGTVETRKF
jgi:uncharacterized Fe-S cluster-containing radical SAM superfamily protein